MPANNRLSDMDLILASLISRETVLRQYIDRLKPFYDTIIVDTSPSLDLMTVNALAAADSVIIPVAPKFLDAKGLELLLKSVAQIRRQINPRHHPRFGRRSGRHRNGGFQFATA
jgi:chromosome partitioning protein